MCDASIKCGWWLSEGSFCDGVCQVRKCIRYLYALYMASVVAWGARRDAFVKRIECNLLISGQYTNGRVETRTQSVAAYKRWTHVIRIIVIILILARGIASRTIRTCINDNNNVEWQRQVGNNGHRNLRRVKKNGNETSWFSPHFGPRRCQTAFFRVD